MGVDARSVKVEVKRVDIDARRVKIDVFRIKVEVKRVNGEAFCVADLFFQTVVFSFFCYVDTCEDEGGAEDCDRCYSFVEDDDGGDEGDKWSEVNVVRSADCAELLYGYVPEEIAEHGGDGAEEDYIGDDDCGEYGGGNFCIGGEEERYHCDYSIEENFSNNKHWGIFCIKLLEDNGIKAP